MERQFPLLKVTVWVFMKSRPVFGMRWLCSAWFRLLHHSNHPFHNLAHHPVNFGNKILMMENFFGILYIPVFPTRISTEPDHGDKTDFNKIKMKMKTDYPVTIQR